MNDKAQEYNSTPDEFEKVQLGPKPRVIPIEWEVKSLSDWLSSLETGGRPKTSERSGSDSILSIGGAHISEGGFDLDEPVYISESYYDELNSGKIQKGDILLVKDGATIGKALYVDKVPEGRAAVNSHVYILRVEGESYDPRFLYHFIKSRIGQNQILRLTTGTAQAGLNRTFQRAVKIPTPPLPEQRRIADILSTVGKQILQTEETIQETRELKRGLMQYYFSGSGADAVKEVRIGANLARIPKSWEITTLSEVCTKIVDGPHSTPDYADEGIPFVSAGDIIDGEIEFDNCKYISEEDDKELRPRVDPSKGDVLLVKVGSSIGKVTVVDTNRRFSIYVQLALIRPDENRILAGYLGSALQYRQMQQQILDHTSGASMQYIGTGLIGDLEIPLPPIEEQKQITRGFTKIRGKIRIERRQEQMLKELKQGLMQDLLTGKVRVKIE